MNEDGELVIVGVSAAVTSAICFGCCLAGYYCVNTNQNRVGQAPPAYDGHQGVDANNVPPVSRPPPYFGEQEENANLDGRDSPPPSYQDDQQLQAIENQRRQDIALYQRSRSAIDSCVEAMSRSVESDVILQAKNELEDSLTLSLVLSEELHPGLQESLKDLVPRLQNSQVSEFKLSPNFMRLLMDRGVIDTTADMVNDQNARWASPRVIENVSDEALPISGSLRDSPELSSPGPRVELPPIQSSVDRSSRTRGSRVSPDEDGRSFGDR